MDLSQFDIQAPVQRNWSEFQLAIFDSAETSQENLIIEAVAGSGKTATILECMNRIPPKSLFLAFNKSIADELRAKVNGAEVRTLNSLGHSILSKRLQGSKLESWKNSQFVRSQLNSDEYVQFGPAVARMISLAKGMAVGILVELSRSVFIEIINSYELDIPQEYIAKACQVAQNGFVAGIKDLSTFDFDDQLFVPIFMNWPFPSFDTVFIDEAQDLNTIQHLMLRRLVDNGARIIAVGDTRQAIYGFRGALSNSMQQLHDDFKCVPLPLSITYRCDRKIVELAQSIVPHIQPRPNAGEGELNFTDEVDILKVSDDTLIVCRNNSPIFSLAMKALVNRRPIRVLSNFTEMLKGFLKSFKTRDLKIFRERLDKWFEFEVKQAEEAGFFGRVAYITDKYETALSLLSAADQFDDMLSALERFSNSTTGPTLSTIHKAKGLEANKTIILNRERMPSRFATSEEALVQEDNLLYVAITRAKHSLTIHTGA